VEAIKPHQFKEGDKFLLQATNITDVIVLMMKKILVLDTESYLMKESE
jgi:hypothetical protein